MQKKQTNSLSKNSSKLSLESLNFSKKNFYTQSRTTLSSDFKELEQNFNLRGEQKYWKLPQYNGISDKYLQDYFIKSNRYEHLVNQGLITLQDEEAGIIKFFKQGQKLNENEIEETEEIDDNNLINKCNVFTNKYRPQKENIDTPNNIDSKFNNEVLPQNQKQKIKSTNSTTEFTIKRVYNIIPSDIKNKKMYNVVPQIYFSRLKKVDLKNHEFTRDGKIIQKQTNNNFYNQKQNKTIIKSQSNYLKVEDQGQLQNNNNNNKNNNNFKEDNDQFTKQTIISSEELKILIGNKKENSQKNHNNQQVDNQSLEETKIDDKKVIQEAKQIEQENKNINDQPQEFRVYNKQEEKEEQKVKMEYKEQTVQNKIQETNQLENENQTQNVEEQQISQQQQQLQNIEQ